MSDDTLDIPSAQRANTTDVVSLNRELRRLRAQLAAHESWAKTKDRKARTQAARDGRWSRYVERAREIHEGTEVTEEFILEVAEHLRQADMKRMSLASSKARSAKKAARKQAG